MVIANLTLWRAANSRAIISLPATRVPCQLRGANISIIVLAWPRQLNTLVYTKADLDSILISVDEIVFWTSAMGGIAAIALQSRRPLPLPSNVDLHGNLNGIVNFYTQMPHRAFNFGMAKQKLHSTQISRLAVDEDGFGSPQRVRSKLQRIKTDACNPIIDEPCILPGGQSSRRIAATEKDLARLPARQPQIIVYGRPGMIRKFEPHWPSSLFLADGRPVKGVSTWCYVLDPDCDDIAAAEFAVDREVEKCQIASAVFNLKPGANGPNLAWP